MVTGETIPVAARDACDCFADPVRHDPNLRSFERKSILGVLIGLPKGFALPRNKIPGLLVLLQPALLFLSLLLWTGMITTITATRISGFELWALACRIWAV